MSRKRTDDALVIVPVGDPSKGIGFNLMPEKREGNRSFAVASVLGPDAEANAKRLVGLWNACRAAGIEKPEGLPEAVGLLRAIKANLFPAWSLSRAEQALTTLGVKEKP